MMAHRLKNKKLALQTRKENILKELANLTKNIDEARNAPKSATCYENDSDSEPELDLDISPSIFELKLQQSLFKTCLHATQELTSLHILQSEVNVLVDEPVFEREPQITKPGTWREVAADCRVDLVPFSMTFYVHQPGYLFAPISYRCLQVTPVKAAHRLELAASVLNTVKTPSDAVEVIRSYARAHRSRRSTLARLVEKYGSSLFMEPGPEGGYVLKCADLIQISWMLQNKWSPISNFHHKMKVDVEYMDEVHIKAIVQVHKQLADPALETDERTNLLSKILNIINDNKLKVQEKEVELTNEQKKSQVNKEIKNNNADVNKENINTNKQSSKVKQVNNKKPVSNIAKAGVSKIPRKRF